MLIGKIGWKNGSWERDCKWNNYGLIIIFLPVYFYLSNYKKLLDSNVYEFTSFC